MAKRDDDLEFSINAPFDDGRAIIDKVPLYLVNGSLGATSKSGSLSKLTANFVFVVSISSLPF